MSALTESTISGAPAIVGVFILNSISTFFKQFASILLLKYASLCTSEILLEISHGLFFSATKYFMTDLYSSLICRHFE